MDIWIFGALFFVIAALVGGVLIHKTDAIQRNANNNGNVKKSQMLKASRVLLPVCYFLFNTVYWVYYLHMIP